MSASPRCPDEPVIRKVIVAPNALRRRAANRRASSYQSYQRGRWRALGTGRRLKLLEPDLAVGALFPDIPDIIDGRAVTLLVVRDRPDDSVECHARMHGCRHLLRIERVRLFGCLLHDLDRSVGVKRIALRIEALGF